MQDILPLGTVAGGADVSYTRGRVVWGNPASLVADTAITLAAGYENRYFAPELSDEYISLSVPTRYFTIGAAFKFFGFVHYHEMMASVSVARRFGCVKLGIEVDYFTLYQLSEARYRHSVTAQAGVHVDCTERLTLGFRFFNPTFTEISFPDVARRLPVILQLGGEYRFVSRLTLLFQVGYVFDNGFDWRIGTEYEVAKCLIVKAGARGLDYVIPSLGAEVRFGGFAFDFLAEADFRIGMGLMSALRYAF